MAPYLIPYKHLISLVKNSHLVMITSVYGIICHYETLPPPSHWLDITENVHGDKTHVFHGFSQ